MTCPEAATDPIAMPSRLTQYTFNELVAVVTQAELEGCASLALDCGALRFVDPFGMIGLLLVSRRQWLRGIPVTLCLPEGNVRSYLGRAGFFQATMPYAEFSPPVDHVWLTHMDQRQGGASTLLETTRLTGTQVIPPVLERVETALRSQLSYPKYEVFDICIVLSEICHNAFDHNQGRFACYVAMQTYTRRSGARFLQISVGDDGMGIPATLRGSPQCAGLTEDWQIIVRSLDNRVSRFDDITRGNGLYHLVGLVLKHGGAVTVRSGTGKVYIRGDKKEGRAFEVARLDGAQFAITFPAR